VLNKERLPFLVSSRSYPSVIKNWAHIDLLNGEGIDEAVKNNKVIFHLASGTKKFDKTIDVDGTIKLLQAAKANNVTHFIYISIVGIDKIPFSYYEYKLQAEKEITQSGLPYTILRATQFHELVDSAFGQFLKLPIGAIPKKIMVQPIDVNIVARELFKIYLGPPLNNILNIGGAEVFQSGDLLAAWLRITKQKKIVINFPIPGELGRALNGGALTCNEKTEDGISWDDWLWAKYHNN
jgi:uncharacterized protein YbjT (DUF2867 family)